MDYLPLYLGLAVLGLVLLGVSLALAARRGAARPSPVADLDDLDDLDDAPAFHLPPPERPRPSRREAAAGLDELPAWSPSAAGDDILPEWAPAADDDSPAFENLFEDEAPARTAVAPLGSLDARIRAFENAFPGEAVREDSIPVLTLRDDALTLEDCELVHLRTGAVFYEAELAEPVFDVGGGLTEENRRIFRRTLVESAVGILYLTTARLVFRNVASTLILALRNLEDVAVHDRHLVLKERGLAGLSVFYTPEAERAAAVIRAVRGRRRRPAPRPAREDADADP